MVSWRYLFAVLLAMVAGSATLTASSGEAVATTGAHAASPATGYWTASSSGSVHAFGRAQSHGQLTLALKRPIVGMAATPDGKGY